MKPSKVNEDVERLERAGARVRFWHLRLWCCNGHKSGYGGATVCCIRDGSENWEKVGIAVCSPKDRFCARVGRAIAFGRALQAPERVTVEANEHRRRAASRLALLVKEYLWRCPICYSEVYPMYSVKIQSGGLVYGTVEARPQIDLKGGDA